METYIRLEKLTNSDKKFFTSKDFSTILGVDSTRTRENTISKLISSGILTQLEKGKYYLTSTKPNEFEISQFIYSPSYISLETALNFHGILSQFPYEITAVTLKKTVTKVIDNKTYVYSQLKKELFTGYVKKGDSLIAIPEKALFDYFYFICKSLKSESYLNEMDLNKINVSTIEEFLSLTTSPIKSKIKALIENYL